jgi:hypothetical protein
MTNTEDAYRTLDAVIDLDRLLANAQDRLYDGIEPVATRPATPIQRRHMSLRSPRSALPLGRQP